MEGKGKRQASNGGGQSTLGYLFGSGCTEQVEEPAGAPVVSQAGVTKPPLMEQDVNAYKMDVNDAVKKMLLKDLRSELRAHGLSPAGGKETLVERLMEHFEKTGHELKSEAFKPVAAAADMERRPSNNYHRPEGQNVGNFLTDRNSSKVLAPPGGASSFSLG
ncbi:SAP domain-containing protein [Chloropicon primus]|uniref:SAP domain-containing protein n=1 Tax=Chloropicon primus TaxID=1764295 RepID=A0A5B8MLE1_9CHLO|nr:hypothetical protein A3770_05p39660 [Chloropicon primus]UPR00660.1 SAP domain-containing protein [Chloropicon primus]|mmetsp:Transcript_5912/g.17792  ORF Transcript_5912/g.17792 Transcript_5912/m.17792 type:complete len:162 (+) Transcript_5912:105-590(+)|eukprot:QDZ21448.1 hypothetical protein A3770_05p39660 [Chloropicon primus]